MSPQRVQFSKGTDTAWTRQHSYPIRFRDSFVGQKQHFLGSLTQIGARHVAGAQKIGRISEIHPVCSRAGVSLPTQAGRFCLFRDGSFLVPCRDVGLLPEKLPEGPML